MGRHFSKREIQQNKTKYVNRKRNYEIFLIGPFQIFGFGASAQIENMSTEEYQDDHDTNRGSNGQLNVHCQNKITAYPLSAKERN